MATIGWIKVGASVETGGLQKGFRKAASEVSRFGSSIAGAGAKLLAFAGIGLSVNALKNYVEGSLKAVAETGKLARRVGITTEALTGLQYAAKLTGTDADALSGSLLKMQKNLSNAAGTAGTLAGQAGGPVSFALRAMGLEVRELAKMKPDEAFLKIAGGFQNIKNPADRAAAAFHIFGKSGAELLNTLNAGPAKIAALQAEAKRLGVTFDDVGATKARMVTAALTKINEASTAWGNQLAIALAPYIELVTTRWMEWYTAASMTDSVNNALGFIAKGIGFVADVVQVLKLGFLGLQIGATVAIYGLLIMIEELGKGLESVINLIPGMHVSFTSTITEMRKGMSGLLHEQMANFNKELAKPPASEGIMSFFDTVKKGADAAAKATVAAAKANTTLGDTFADLNLAEQKAKSLIDASKSPLQKYKEEMASLNKLLKAGFIDQKVFAAASGEAFKTLAEDSKKGIGDPTARAGAQELGSAEARSSILNARGLQTSGDPVKDVARNTKEQLRLQAEANRLSQRMVDALGGQAALATVPI